MHMATEKIQAESLTDKEVQRAAMLADRILSTARYEGFTICELTSALKMVNQHLEDGCGLKPLRWGENSIDWHLSRSYLPG